VTDHSQIADAGELSRAITSLTEALVYMQRSARVARIINWSLLGGLFVGLILLVVAGFLVAKSFHRFLSTAEEEARYNKKVQENVAFSIKKAIVRKHLNYKQDQIGPVHYIDLRPDQMGPVEYLTFAYDLVQGMTPDERVDFVNALKDEMTSEQEKALVDNLVREVPLWTTDQGTLGLRKDDRILLESEAKKMTPEEFFREYAYNRILLKSDKYMGIFVGILSRYTADGGI